MVASSTMSIANYFHPLLLAHSSNCSSITFSLPFNLLYLLDNNFSCTLDCNLWCSYVPPDSVWRAADTVLNLLVNYLTFRVPPGNCSQLGTIAQTHINHKLVDAYTSTHGLWPPNTHLAVSTIVPPGLGMNGHERRSSPVSLYLLRKFCLPVPLSPSLLLSLARHIALSGYNPSLNLRNLPQLPSPPALSGTLL